MFSIVFPEIQTETIIEYFYIDCCGSYAAWIFDVYIFIFYTLNIGFTYKVNVVGPVNSVDTTIVIGTIVVC